ncbi:hypothetical protein ACEPPN_006169 [Leptodophora sp. 'Broadleaf-Isolate-01']
MAILVPTVQIIKNAPHAQLRRMKRHHPTISSTSNPKFMAALPSKHQQRATILTTAMRFPSTTCRTQVISAPPRNVPWMDGGNAASVQKKSILAGVGQIVQPVVMGTATTATTLDPHQSSSSLVLSLTCDGISLYRWRKLFGFHLLLANKTVEVACAFPTSDSLVHSFCISASLVLRHSSNFDFHSIVLRFNFMQTLVVRSVFSLAVDDKLYPT